jgi:hypothetical protein
MWFDIFRGLKIYLTLNNMVKEKNITIPVISLTRCAYLGMYLQ